MELTIKCCKQLRGMIKVPGDKSISHRAVMLGSLAEGKTVIHNFLSAEDCLTTVKCFQALGVDITSKKNSIIIEGRGLYGLKEPTDVVDCGNSGTTARLLLGILAGQPFFSVLTGDFSLRRRPMDRIVTPLAQMGASFMGRKDNLLLPLAVKGSNLKCVNYKTPVASAQIKSAILLAGLFASGRTVVQEPAASRDHTERMLALFGAQVDIERQRVAVTGKPILTGQKLFVPGDISAAAFFMVAAAIIPGSDIIINDVGLNPTRKGVLEALGEMGADIDVINLRQIGSEPMGDIRVKGSRLKGTVIGGELIPRLIDEIPVLAVAAAVAEGNTIFRDAAELRVKESDRIKAVATELTKFGVQVQEQPDGMIIKGGRPLKGTICQSYGDHRMAMAMAVAGLVAEGKTVVKDAASINISFPNFIKTLNFLRVD